MASGFFNAFRQSFSQMSVPTKIVLLLFLVLFWMIIGTILATILALPIFNLSLTEIYAVVGFPTEENIGIVKYFQIVQSIFLFIVPALMTAWLFGEGTFNYLKADKKAQGITLALAAISIATAIPLLNAVTMLNSKLDLPVWLDGMEIKIKVMEETAGRLTELFLVSNSWTTLGVNFLMIAILPALGEEFLFRGVIQRLLGDWTKNSHIAIVLTAFIFSFIHFQFYGFIPRFLLGLYFGYLLLWSSSIWVPVTGHLINNGLSVVYYHFSKESMGETALDKVGTESGGDYVVYLSVLVTAFMVWGIYYKEKKVN